MFPFLYPQLPAQFFHKHIIQQVMKLFWLLRGSLTKSVSDRNPLDSFPGFYVLYERTSVGTERSSEEAPLHNETHISSRILN